MRLENRLALVTSATKDRGKAITTAYLKEGAHVIATAPTAQELDLLANSLEQDIKQPALTLLPLPPAATSQILQACYEIGKRWKMLDILVLNPLQPTPLRPIAHIPPNLWKDAFNNLHSVQALLCGLTPLLKASKNGGHILLTSCHNTEKHCAYSGASTTPLAALEYMMRIYQKEMLKTSIKINIIKEEHMKISQKKSPLPNTSTPDVTEQYITLAL